MIPRFWKTKNKQGQIKNGWYEVSVKDYIKYVTSDNIEQLSILSGFDYVDINKDELLRNKLDNQLAWRVEEPQQKKQSKLIGALIPEYKDSVGQYEYLKSKTKHLESVELTTISNDVIDLYLWSAAIYAQPILDKKFKSDRIEYYYQYLQDQSIQEVVTLGGFFLQFSASILDY